MKFPYVVYILRICLVIGVERHVIYITKEKIMKNKVVGLILSVMMLSILCMPVQAEEPPIVLLDGQVLTFEVPPIIENGRVLVPMAAIFQAMGAVVSWDSSTGTATAVKDGITVQLTIGSAISTINGEAKTLDVPAQIVNERTLAPLSFVGQAFGASVSWNPDSRTVSINTGTVERDVSLLIKAICLSESLHYDSFNDEPDNITTTYTLFNLVSNNQFSWNEQLQPIDGDFFFSSGPESENAGEEGGPYIAPQLLYQDFFVSGTYKYPPANLGFLIEGTQTGIAVHLRTIPADVEIEVKSVEKGDYTTRFLLTVSRISDENKAELLGDAVLTLHKDSTAYFGYRIVSYVPLYSGFDDIKLQ